MFLKPTAIGAYRCYGILSDGQIGAAIYSQLSRIGITGATELSSVLCQRRSAITVPHVVDETV